MERRGSLISANSRGSNINIDNYLTIEALEDGLTISLSSKTIEYCINGDGNWKSLTKSTESESINTGQTISLRLNLPPQSHIGNTNSVGTFTITKKCNLLGNCNSILFGDDANSNTDLTGYQYCFENTFQNCSNIIRVSENFLPASKLVESCYSNMFQGCTSLIVTPKLPATTLEYSCYSSMFKYCSSLAAAPELPATTLADLCYSSMFRGCTSLTTAPELPAIIMNSYCYASMFSNCTSLITAPELPAKSLAQDCYSSMFGGCSSLVVPPVLPATSVTTQCYQHMFSNCTSLITAPELPAMKLAMNCYRQMFYGCNSLNYIKMLATDISSSGCLSSWVSGVASSGTFVKNADATWDVTGSSGIPSGWTVVLQSPYGGTWGDGND